MTHIIIALDGSTYIHKESDKSPEELCREVRMGSFQSPVALKDPTAVQLQNYLLIAERQQGPLLSTTQRNILELLSMGASEKDMESAMHLSQSGIRHHVDALKRKFNVKTRQELITAYCRMN